MGILGLADSTLDFPLPRRHYAFLLKPAWTLPHRAEIMFREQAAHVDDEPISPFGRRRARKNIKPQRCREHAYRCESLLRWRICPVEPTRRHLAAHRDRRRAQLLINRVCFVKSKNPRATWRDPVSVRRTFSPPPTFDVSASVHGR